MDYAALFLAGLGIGGAIMAVMARVSINTERALAAVYYKEFANACIECGEANKTLRSLRASCSTTRSISSISLTRLSLPAASLANGQTKHTA